MWEYGLPVLFALFLWWFSTGAILYLNRLPSWTYRWTLCSATIVLMLSLHGLAASGAETSATGAYLAFTYALLVWGWHEIAFLTGFLTGPCREACPADRRGWRRTSHAVGTILYHELAIAGTAVVVAALTWNAPNQFGTWTFMILWAMRLSSKLNIFLGVPNLMEGFLPAHLGYLKSVFTRKSMNLLFPVSVTVSTVLAVMLVQQATRPEAGGLEIAGYTLLATLMILAIVEHWFLVLPLHVLRLWSWGLRSAPQKRFAITAKDGATVPLSTATRPIGGGHEL